MENSDNETRHNTNAVVSEQDLADTYFPAFMSCANRGKASGVMCSYNAVNGSSALLRMSPHFSSCAAEPSWIAGVPSCASKELLNDNMRSKWGFNGYITSDCGAVGNVANAEPSGHGFTHDDSNLTAKTTLEARYDFSNREAFERYERESAPLLREEGLQRFPPSRGAVYHRSTGVVVFRE